MSDATSDGEGVPAESGASSTDRGEPTASTAGTTSSEYEHLRTKKKERRGNAEPARVRDVFVGEDQVVVGLSFDWTTDGERLVYDLNDDRDVLKLEAVAESKGYAFEQLPFLEDETLTVVYTGREWVPEAQVAHVEGEGSAGETFLTELRLLGRELARSPKALRRLVRASRTLTTRQLIVAVILVKKLIIVALLVWLLV